MRCRVCGGENLEDATTCAACGEPVPSESLGPAGVWSAGSDDSRSGQGGASRILVGAVILLGIGAAGLIFTANNGGRSGGGGVSSSVATSVPGTAAVTYGSHIAPLPVNAVDERYARGVAAAIIKRSHPEYAASKGAVTAYLSDGQGFLQVTYGRAGRSRATGGSTAGPPGFLIISIRRGDNRVSVYESN
jgi:hypothetical protein